MDGVGQDHAQVALRRNGLLQPDDGRRSVSDDAAPAESSQSGVCTRVHLLPERSQQHYSLSPKKDYVGYLVGRVRRVAVPYWKYALLCLPLVVGYYVYTGRELSAADLLGYAFFTPPVVPRIFSHIWFVLPYLVISLFIPPVYKGIQRYSLPFVLLFVGFFLLVGAGERFDMPGLVRTVVVYLLFAVWGMYYKRNSGWQVGVCVVLSLLCLGHGWMAEGRWPDLQVEKFPPSMLFVAYGVAVLGLAGGLMARAAVWTDRRWKEASRLIGIYSREGYSIYLIHPFSTLLLFGVRHVLGLNAVIAGSVWLKTAYVLFAFLFLLYTNLLLLRILRWLESRASRIIRTKRQANGDIKQYTK